MNENKIYYNKFTPPIFFFIGAMYGIIQLCKYNSDLWLLHYVAIPLIFLSLSIISIWFTVEYNVVQK